MRVPPNTGYATSVAFLEEDSYLVAIYINRGDGAEAVVDPDARWTLQRDAVLSSAGYSIYEGWPLTGRVVHTLVRGRFVLRDGALQEAGIGTGRYVRRRLD
jgi:hypothetical protein